MPEKKFSIKLTDGAKLCVEASNDSDYPNELYVFLKYPNGITRDLIGVQQEYIYPKDADGIQYLPNKIRILLTREGSPDFKDEQILDMTEERKIIEAYGEKTDGKKDSDAE